MRGASGGPQVGEPHGLPLSDSLVIGLDGVAPALSDVRRKTAAFVDGLDEDKVGDLLLIVTELVSNAYDHGLRALEVRLTGDADTVRIEVDDESPDRPVLGQSRLGATRGNGLRMVQTLCVDWGVTWRDKGKTVWAVMARQDG
ncbi:ATP-binding protein [Saccharothrix yanglingensis]|uniref:ATPase n=1 Tax=Saccharothrix yanglingensis TaxID=659496 RepID=A0ABU0WYV6_9PSEU|nr:ATP-binding protein [Saccharothrix yanglingensis]MDQ2585046.1 ATPase [Saccharothrix yanglingensis]